jgi:hypothetical protein
MRQQDPGKPEQADAQQAPIPPPYPDLVNRKSV